MPDLSGSKYGTARSGLRHPDTKACTVPNSSCGTVGSSRLASCRLEVEAYLSGDDGNRSNTPTVGKIRDIPGPSARGRSTGRADSLWTYDHGQARRFSSRAWTSSRAGRAPSPPKPLRSSVYGSGSAVIARRGRRSGRAGVGRVPRDVPHDPSSVPSPGGILGRFGNPSPPNATHG